MDHVVYLDFEGREFEKLTKKTKSVIIRGATGRKTPYGRVFKNDVLYFINNNGEGLVKAKALVKEVFNSDKMTEKEATELVMKYRNELNLSSRQFLKWSKKRYLVLIMISSFTLIDEFEIDKSEFKNMDDWLIVENIKNVIRK